MEDVERGDAFEILFFVEGENTVDTIILHDDSVNDIADAGVAIEECRSSLPRFSQLLSP